ncbi:MAG: TIGR03643 family protein [Pseudomonadota bacterium]
MSRAGSRPYTRTSRPEPSEGSEDWIIWAAWADRVSFDEIEERTGYRESDVIKLMRRELKSSSFRLWRKRVSGRGTKHRARFEEGRHSFGMEDC